MKRFKNLVQYSRESVTIVTVTLTSDTCDTFAGDTGTPNGRPYTTSPPIKYFSNNNIYNFSNNNIYSFKLVQVALLYSGALLASGI